MSYLYVNRNKYERIKVRPFRDALPDLLPLPFPVWLQETLFPKLVRETCAAARMTIGWEGCSVAETLYSYGYTKLMHQHCNLLQNLYGWPQHHAKAWQLLP